MDISKYDSVNAYKEAARARGIGVPLPLCRALSSIMGKYQITFAEACKLLEKEGYLIWADEVPVYNLEGDKLWMGDEDQQTTVVQEPEPNSIYTTDKEIKSVFFTLVVRNEALERKYEGGTKAFVQKYWSSYNGKITVRAAMVEGYLGETIEDIQDSGLSPKEDFILFDADQFPFKDYAAVKLDVDWLEGYYLNGGAMVYHTVRD